MFDLNERVKICITQDNISGKVKGILSPDLYLSQQRVADVPMWTSYFPDWKSKAVYILELDEPIKTIKYDSFKDQYIGMDEEIIQQAYKAIPLYSFMNIPEDDLEIFYENKSYIKDGK